MEMNMTDINKNNSEEIEGQISFITGMEDDSRKKNDTMHIIMAVMFALSRPVSASELSKATGLAAAETMDELLKLKEMLIREDGALVIKTVGDKYQLATNERFFGDIVKAVSAQKKPELSDVIMETLAIIAGKGRATRIDVEKVRGVKSDFAVNKLIEYGLIEEKGRLSVPGKPIVFGPTDEFYRRFGVGDDMPMPKISEEAEALINGEVQIEIKDILGPEGI